MPDVSTRRRVSSGVPTGGQFDTEERGYTLDLDPDAGADDAIDAALSSVSDAETAAAYAEITRVARAYAMRVGLDPEDTAQHVATEWYVARQKGELQTSVASFTRRWCRERSVTDATQGRSRAHAAAMSKFKIACREEEQRLGHTLSEKEKEVVAERVLASLKDNSWNRLPKGWWKNEGLRTLATDYTEATFAHPQAPGADERDVDALDPEDQVDRITMGLEARRAKEEGPDVPLTSSETRMVAWELVSRRSGGSIPAARTGCLSQRAVTAHRRTLLPDGDDAPSYDGGVIAACRSWDRGDFDEGTEALFAPFGGLEDDYEGRDRITAMLRAQPAFANDLWSSAAQQANRQFAEKFTSVTARIAS